MDKFRLISRNPRDETGYELGTVSEWRQDLMESFFPRRVALHHVHATGSYVVIVDDCAIADLIPAWVQ